MDNMYGIDFSCYLKGFGTSSGEEIVANGILERYEQCMKKGETIKMVFSLATANGDLMLQDGACKVILPNKEITGREYNPYARADRLNQSYAVKVTSVDKAKQEVIVSHYAVRSVDRERLCQYMNAALDKKEYCTVPARVIVVYNNVALLNIGGLGIPGYLNISNWSSLYTRNLRGVVKKGDILNVAVIAKGELWCKKRYFNDSDVNPYECSRRLIVSDDPWEGIEKKIPEKSMVRIKCIERAEHNFYGVIDGIPEIQAYCYYPEEESVLCKGDIVPGCYYEGYVKKVDESTRRLRIRVFRRVDME